MLKDQPYSILKQDERAYEIMLLRDQCNNTFADIAKECGISNSRVVQIYNKIKFKQIHLYIYHIAAVLGYEDATEVRKVCDHAYDFYWDERCACAYLEKKYQDILTEYRNGEPGMPPLFIKSMPPFKPKLSKKTVARVIEMRDAEKASFVTIAKELRITQAKARHTYECFYHEKVLKLIQDLIEEAQSAEDKNAIWEHYFWANRSAKTRYDMLTKKA